MIEGSCAGCLENVHGFYPLRNQDSKWYISYEEMPDEVVRSKAQHLGRYESKVSCCHEGTFTPSR